MLTISREHIRNMMRLELLAHQRETSEQIAAFENKYNCSFSEFENRVRNTHQENFEHWDDFLEWKALENTQKTLTQNLAELKHGNFKITG